MSAAEMTFRAFDMLGTIAFSISGAVVASKKRMDLFGVLFLGVMTALGGGMLRDMLLGNFPPALFSNWVDLSLANLTAFVVFLVIRYQREQFFRREQTVERINNVVDAAGLGAFAVTGCQVCIADGYAPNLFLVVCMGMLTAVGGGLIRDLMLSEIPFIFTKHVYAVAALLGSAVYCALLAAGVDKSVSMALGIGATFVLRLLSTHYRWNLPRAL